MRNRTQDDYYAESRRLRAVVMDMAKGLIDHPMTFSIYNGIFMNVKVTNSDLRSIANKNTRNNKFNAIKNALAMDLQGYLEKAENLVVRPYSVCGR